MFATHFHSASGDNPNGSLEIDFRPSRSPNLAGSSRCQDSKFKRARSDSLDVAQALHKGT
jgi:hypothetical protein